MQDQEMYFNDKPFPDNETSNDAFIKCYDDASAKAYCPKRYKAMQAWIKNSKEASSFGRLLRMSDNSEQKWWSANLAHPLAQLGFPP